MSDRELAVEAWESLFRAQHEVLAEISSDFSEHELNQPEYDVMLTVYRGEAHSARLREVTTRMLISQPSVSRLVDRMVARGLVTKSGDPRDGRGHILTATEKGASLFRAVGTSHARTIATRMAVLTDDELTSLLAITQKLRGVESGRELPDSAPGRGAARRTVRPGLSEYRGIVMTSLAESANAARRSRPLELQIHEMQWGTDWFRTERMVGGRCYPDRFAGNLAGIRDDIAYFRELGVTFLHLLGVVVGERGERRISPSLGSPDRLADLAADLHLAGIALVLDLPVGDVSDAAEELVWLAGLGVDAFLASGSPEDVAELREIAAATAASVVVIGAGADLDSASPDDALIWEALASRDARILQHSLSRRPAKPRLVAVRDENALGWHLNPDDASGRDLAAHTRFLADFYTGDRPGAFGRGTRNPGAVEVCGTAAALAGMDVDGIDSPAAEDRLVLVHAIAFALCGVPVLYLGDEVGQLSDPTFADDPERRDDLRWIHRGNRPRDRYARKRDTSTAPGRIFRRVTKLVSVRRIAHELGGTDLIPFDAGDSRVLGFLRPHTESAILVLANVGASSATITARTLSGLEPHAYDLIEDSSLDLRRGISLPPHGFAWVRVRLAPTTPNPTTDRTTDADPSA